MNTPPENPPNEADLEAMAVFSQPNDGYIGGGIGSGLSAPFWWKNITQQKTIRAFAIFSISTMSGIFCYSNYMISVSHELYAGKKSLQTTPSGNSNNLIKSQ